MTHKSHDLAVKVGTYEKNGETKGRYKNCGMVLQKDDGGEIIMIDPTFNFAAVKRGEDRDMVIISKFEVKEKQQAAQEWSE
jgi:hypothetical protein